MSAPIVRRRVAGKTLALRAGSRYRARRSALFVLLGAALEPVEIARVEGGRETAVVSMNVQAGDAARLFRALGGAEGRVWQ